MVIAIESVVLGALCLFDLVSTVCLIHFGLATEANPLLDFYIRNGGMICFAAAKILLSMGPLFALEVIRRRRPRLVQGLLRLGIVLYLTTYGLGGALANSSLSPSESMRGAIHNLVR